jgi:hypothetical protein
MIAVFCADVGSVRSGNFGWYGVPASGEACGGSHPSELVNAVVRQLSVSAAVALGFECPLFVPVPLNANSLGKARSGERNRPWSAGAGAGSLATGLVQLAWVLREIRRHAPETPFALDAPAFLAAPSGVLIWEAFVSGAAHTDTHVNDARAAVERFIADCREPFPASAITSECPLSLAGAALEFAGISGFGSTACHVLRV